MGSRDLVRSAGHLGPSSSLVSQQRPKEKPSSDQKRDTGFLHISFLFFSWKINKYNNQPDQPSGQRSGRLLVFLEQKVKFIFLFKMCYCTKKKKILEKNRKFLKSLKVFLEFHCTRQVKKFRPPPPEGKGWNGNYFNINLPPPIFGDTRCGRFGSTLVFVTAPWQWWVI